MRLRSGRAGVQGFVHAGRAAASGGLAQHGDEVVAALVRRVAQRVLAHQAVGQVQVDVGASVEGGQRIGGFVDGHQGERHHVLGLYLAVRHAHAQLAVGRVGCRVGHVVSVVVMTAAPPVGRGLGSLLCKRCAIAQMAERRQRGRRQALVGQRLLAKRG